MTTSDMLRKIIEELTRRTSDGELEWRSNYSAEGAAGWMECQPAWGVLIRCTRRVKYDDEPDAKVSMVSIQTGLGRLLVSDEEGEHHGDLGLRTSISALVASVLDWGPDGRVIESAYEALIGKSAKEGLE